LSRAIARDRSPQVIRPAESGVILPSGHSRRLAMLRLHRAALRLGTNLRMTRPININTPTIKTNPSTSGVDAAAAESIVAAVMKVMIKASQIDNERGGFMTQVLPEFANRSRRLSTYGVCPKLLSLFT